MTHKIICPNCKATLATVTLPDNLSATELAYRLSGYACGNCATAGKEEQQIAHSTD